MKYFTVIIPTYEMHGKGAEFLRHSLTFLEAQTFKDFEVLITDHSQDDSILNVCNEFATRLSLKYYKNEEGVGNFTVNTNTAIDLAKGKWIKILFQDDFLPSDTCLEILHSKLEQDPNVRWAVNGCYHSYDGFQLYRPFEPKWNDRLREGINTISSPSVMCIKNTEDKLYFDNDFIWMMDIDYYLRAEQAFGMPMFIPDKLVAIRTWEKQVSQTMSGEEKHKEQVGIHEKHK